MEKKEKEVRLDIGALGAPRGASVVPLIPFIFPCCLHPIACLSGPSTALPSGLALLKIFLNNFG